MILQMYCLRNTFASVYNTLLRIRNSGQRMDASLPDCFSFCMSEIHFCFIPVREFMKINRNIHSGRGCRDVYDRGVK